MCTVLRNVPGLSVGRPSAALVPPGQRQSRTPGLRVGTFVDRGGTMALALEGLRVIDADTHLTEAHDLWTSRAPSKYADRVPRVEVIDGRPMWMVDGAELGFAGGGGVIDRQGGKGRALEALYEWTI